MAGRFDAKTALVTGAGSGIGMAAAMALAAEGASVVVNDLDLQAARDVVEKITEKGGSAVASAGDVANPEDVAGAVQLAVSEFGALNLAFNNAGISGPLGPLADIDLEGYRRVIDVNLNSVFYSMYYEIPQMLQAGGGAIVNNSSILGTGGGRQRGAVCDGEARRRRHDQVGGTGLRRARHPDQLGPAGLH